jgi:urea transporter
LAGAAFFAPAFFDTSFLAGLFGMSRTLCRLALCCQFRHDAIYIQAII